MLQFLLTNNMRSYIFHQMSYTWSLGCPLVLVCVEEHSPSYSMELCPWVGSGQLLSLHGFTQPCEWRRAQITQRDVFLLLAPCPYCAFSKELLLDKVKKQSLLSASLQVKLLICWASVFAVCFGPRASWLCFRDWAYLQVGTFLWRCDFELPWAKRRNEILYCLGNYWVIIWRQDPICFPNLLLIGKH